jgi:organic hydroperoxide reductase OsmC/OhrA
MTICVDRTKTRPASNRFMIIHKAQVVWSAAAAGNGAISAMPGVNTEALYSLTTGFESGKGRSPEELLAAAHAGRFTLDLALSLQGGRLRSERVEHGGYCHSGARRSGISHQLLCIDVARRGAKPD